MVFRASRILENSKQRSRNIVFNNATNIMSVGVLITLLLNARLRNNNQSLPASKIANTGYRHVRRLQDHNQKRISD